MDLGLQAKLLRVLQEREVERLGGTKKIIADYEVREGMLGNVDVVVSFKKSVEVPAR